MPAVLIILSEQLRPLSATTITLSMLCLLFILWISGISVSFSEVLPENKLYDIGNPCLSSNSPISTIGSGL